MVNTDVKRLLAEHASRHQIPGASLAVSIGRSVLTAEYGISDVRTSEPVTHETRFAIGSLTKTLSAAVLLLLARDGELSIDDTVAENVPELRESPWAKTATVRDLLANNSRIPQRARWEFDLEFEGEHALTRCASLLADARPAGDFWSYSNLGWSVLGRVIESSTGLLWEEAVERTVLGPAGLRRTAFASGSDIRAVGHELTPHGPEPAAAWTPRAYCSAGATGTSTAGDLVRFAGWLLAIPALAPMRESHADVAIHGWLDGWGLGLARFDWDSGPAWGWDGVVPGQRAFLRLLPARNAAVALTTNAGNGRAMFRTLLSELLDEILDVRVLPLRLDPSWIGDLHRYAGRYEWPDRRCEVTADGDGLVIEVDDRTLRALPADERVFIVDPKNPDNPTITFGGFDEQGRPNVLYLMLWGLPREGPSPPR